MNAKAETTIAIPSVADVEKRIAEERNRLQMELNLQADLEAQRSVPLESGDDAALDRIDEKLAQCLARQGRIEERLQIHTTRLAEAKAAEEEAASIARAQRSAELAEELDAEMASYNKLAAKLVASLRRIALLDCAVPTGRSAAAMRIQENITIPAGTMVERVPKPSASYDGSPPKEEYEEIVRHKPAEVRMGRRAAPFYTEAIIPNIGFGNLYVGADEPKPQQYTIDQLFDH